MDEDSYIGNTTLRMEFLQTKHHTTVFDNEAYVLVSKDYSNCLVRTTNVIENYRLKGYGKRPLVSSQWV